MGFIGSLCGPMAVHKSTGTRGHHTSLPCPYSKMKCNGDFMHPIRASSLRWGVTAALALMLCALLVTPTLAGEDLIPGQEVVSGTISFGAFGPVGPGCSSTTGGPNCTFATSNVTGKGKAVPGGPFTHTSTTTVFYGPGPGSFLFPSGAVDSTGNPAGYCAEISGTSHSVFANGTIDGNAQGYTCCSSSSCTTALGPPITTFVTTACTSGTGKYAGIQCSGKESSSSSDGVHFLARGEGVSTK
jgi:hypothetical protein